MSKVNFEIILNKSCTLFATTGYELFTIRRLAKSINISPSVIYHYFKNEDDLLFSMFKHTNSSLSKKRLLLKKPKLAKNRLKQIINFQIDNSEQIVAVLKYYLAYRNNFIKHKYGFIPDKSSLHIEEVIKYGISTCEFKTSNLKGDSKVITHAINGFLLEYYPHVLNGNEKKKITSILYKFIIKALKGGDKK